MTKELEIAGLASIGGWLRRLSKNADIPPGTPCPNCETVLQGPFCHACGQMAEDYHKSIWRLFMEVVESFTNFDGRLWRTLPNLVLKPGRLTRGYLDGQRAPQVPPFRMFLISLVIVFLAGQCSMQNRTADTPNILPGAGVANPSAARAEVLNDPTLTQEEKERSLAVIDGDWAKFGRSIQDEVDRERAKADAEKAAAAARAKADPNAVALDVGGEKLTLRAKEDENTALNNWAEKRIEAIRKNPELFMMTMEKWASRVAILALPVSALILALLFVFQRRFYVFDHLVFSMHSLTFQLLLLTVILLGSMVTGPVIWLLILLSPVHLFVHMRGTYGTGVFLTLVRMWLLWFLTTIAFSLLMFLWLYLSANEMGGR